LEELSHRKLTSSLHGHIVFTVSPPSTGEKSVAYQRAGGKTPDSYLTRMYYICCIAGGAAADAALTQMATTLGVIDCFDRARAQTDVRPLSSRPERFGRSAPAA